MKSLIGSFYHFNELLQDQMYNLTKTAMDSNLFRGSLVSVSRLSAPLRLKVEA